MVFLSRTSRSSVSSWKGLPNSLQRPDLLYECRLRTCILVVTFGGDGCVLHTWRRLLQAWEPSSSCFTEWQRQAPYISKVTVDWNSPNPDWLNKVRSLDAVAPCSHEEADTRVFVHARDATSQCRKSITIKANDTDVVVIAVSTMPSLQELKLQKLWIEFGQGASARWIHVHEMVSSVGPEKVSDDDLQKLKNFVVLMYDRSTLCFKKTRH